VLQNVNSANGTVTVVTQDGKTVTIKIADNTVVVTPSANETIGNLAPGASVEIKIEKGKGVARQIEAKQAKVSGNITGIVSGNVTIQPEKGNPVTVLVTDNTRIELEDDDVRSTLADLQVGLDVEAKYDPTTKQAFKIELQDKEDNRGKDRDRKTSEIGWGIVEIRVTNQPPAGVKSAVVNLNNIEVHMAGNDGSANTSGNITSTDNNSGWISIIGAPVSFDLMDVTAINQILGSANITAGKYTQIRMSVTNVTGVTTDNVSFTAQVPGDKLKIVGNFNVGDGKKTVLTLDFDGDKSLIRQGNGQFLFNPVVKLLVNNQGKGNVDDRGDSDKGRSGENEGKDKSGRSDNNSGKSDDSGRSSNNSGRKD
jgi:hypothetical protein